MYTEKNFTGCTFNPLIKDFRERYENLFEIVPVDFVGDKEKLLKYICLMYDPKSPLITDTASIDTRKRNAAQYAGYAIDEKGLNEIFELTNKHVIEVIDVFLRRHINERLAYMIFGNEQTFFEYGKRLLQPVEWKEDSKEKDLLSAIAIKTKLSEDMAAINARIEADYKRLYNNDAHLEKVVTKRAFTPEGFAAK